jgi:hypothetical protein
MRNALSNRRGLACVVALTTAGIAASPVACGGGGSSDQATTTPPPGDGGARATTVPADAGAVSTEAGACTRPTVPIVFSPMYSAFVPGSVGQTFAIPAITADGNAATWSLSDPSQGNLQLQSFEADGVANPGVLITLTGTGNDAGQVTVIATETSGACGESVLSITQNTLDDWNIGNARYNDGVSLHLGRPAGFEAGAPPVARDAGFEGGSAFSRDGGGFMGGLPLTADGGSYFETDGGTACTNCHGPTATSGPYKTVSHTPEQTGGFSDGDLENIILNGEVPDGGYFDPTVLVASCDGGPTCTAQAMALWHSFHRWDDITSDELPGVICYLRSLTPESQTGSSNFGGGAGRLRRDGGARP